MSESDEDVLIIDGATAELEQHEFVHATAFDVVASFSQASALDHPSSTKSIMIAMWLHVRGEVHSLLCTNSAVYRNERNLLKTSIAPAVTVLTASLVDRFGVSVGTASSLAALALLVPLKIAVRAWCSNVATRSETLSREEKLALKKIADAGTETPTR
jgi:hypothetical protein